MNKIKSTNLSLRAQGLLHKIRAVNQPRFNLTDFITKEDSLYCLREARKELLQAGLVKRLGYKTWVLA